MPQCGVYQIVNTITGNCYIGSTVDFQSRRSRHLNLLRKGIHHSQHLQNAYNKYGEEAFTFIFVEEVVKDRKLLFEREGHWIRELQPQYNVGKLAETMLGVKRTEETRKRMSESARVRPKPDPEVVARIAAKRRGTKQSPETILKKVESLKGREVSEETRQQIAETNRETWAKKSAEEKRAIVEKRSQEVQETNRERMRQLGKDPERIEKSRQATLGITRSEETRQRLREAWVRRKQRQLENPQPAKEDTKPTKEYKYSEERRARMSAGKKASWDKKKSAQAETIQQSLFD